MDEDVEDMFGEMESWWEVVRIDQGRFSLGDEFVLAV